MKQITDLVLISNYDCTSFDKTTYAGTVHMKTKWRPVAAAKASRQKWHTGLQKTKRLPVAAVKASRQKWHTEHQKTK